MKKGACREKERKPASPKFQRLAEGGPSGAPKRYQAFISNQRFRSRGFKMSVNKWTQKEMTELRGMIASGADQMEVAEALGRSLKAVIHRMHVMGVRANKTNTGPWSAVDKATLSRLWNGKNAVGEIARELGRSISAIQNQARAMGLMSKYKSVYFSEAMLSKAPLPKKHQAKVRRVAAKLFASVDHSPEAMEARRARSRMNHAKAQRNWVQDMFRGCEIPKSTLKRLGLSTT